MRFVHSPCLLGQAHVPAAQWLRVPLVQGFAFFPGQMPLAAARFALALELVARRMALVQHQVQLGARDLF